MKRILLVLTFVISTLNAIDTDENSPVAKRRRVEPVNVPHLIDTLRNRECGRLNTADQELLFRLRHPDKPVIDAIFDGMDTDYEGIVLSACFDFGYRLQLKELAPSILRLPAHFLHTYVKAGRSSIKPWKREDESIVFDDPERVKIVCGILINHLLADDTIPEQLPKLLCCLHALYWGAGRIESIERINKKINPHGQYPELTALEKNWKRDYFKSHCAYISSALAKRMRGDYSSKIKFSGGRETLERRNSI